MLARITISFQLILLDNRLGEPEEDLQDNIDYVQYQIKFHWITTY